MRSSSLCYQEKTFIILLALVPCIPLPNVEQNNKKVESVFFVFPPIGGFRSPSSLVHLCDYAQVPVPKHCRYIQGDMNRLYPEPFILYFNVLSCAG